MFFAPLLAWVGYRTAKTYFDAPPLLEVATAPPLSSPPNKPSDGDVIAVAFIVLAAFMLSKG